ncbi:MAG: hypothetical protein HZB53_13870 [Chloroflexi bacterium]|nr:hypothetical protein [Chloroflexota bacterium]
MSRVVKGGHVHLGALQVVQPASPAPVRTANPHAAPAPDDPPLPSREDVLCAYQAEAEALVRDAKMRAESLIAAARAEGDRMRQAAVADGFAEGHAHGLAAAQDEARAQLESVLRMAASAADSKAKLIAQAEPTIVELAIAVAKKILDEQVEINPRVVAQIAARAIEQVSGVDRIVVRVNPRDVEQLQAAWQEALSSSSGVRSFEIVADRRVGLGGCVIETPFGRVDAQIDTQLKNIRETFNGAADAETPARS